MAQGTSEVKLGRGDLLGSASEHSRAVVWLNSSFAPTLWFAFPGSSCQT